MKFQVHCKKESFFTPKSICVYLLTFILCIVLIWLMAPGKEEYAAFKIKRKKLMDQVEKETVERGLEQYHRVNEEGHL